MLISWGFQCICCLATHGAKDGVKMCTLIGIMHQRLILYTLASFGSDYSPTIPIYVYVRASNQTP
jgi:hypothetical protein